MSAEMTWYSCVLLLPARGCAQLLRGQQQVQVPFQQFESCSHIPQGVVRVKGNAQTIEPVANDESVSGQGFHHGICGVCVQNYERTYAVGRRLGEPCAIPCCLQ